MGTKINHSHFREADFQNFSKRLKQNLADLQSLLDCPAFGKGKTSIGAELELTLIDNKSKASWLNQIILEQANDPQLTPELNQYNLEYNLSAVTAIGKPFTAIADEMQNKLATLNELASKHNARSIAIGILPTLTDRDISADVMTPDNRYQVLADTLTQLRGTPFEIDIDGEDPLSMQTDCLTVEGANTSFQLHLRVEPDHFANMYNAAQMASAVVLAISGNSPLFLQHRLWQESRVPLFKQAVDVRSEKDKASGRISRTGLGKDWIRHSALELFEQSVEEFPVILPECADTHNTENGEKTAPPLSELRLHHGSIWHWNRAIYDPADGGHLRIEMRALPSGPTVIDMMANAAFIIGLTRGLSHHMKRYTALIPFKTVKYNFYRAAQRGLEADLFWPETNAYSLTHTGVPMLIEQLLPIAASGLTELGVEQEEFDPLLAIIAARAKSGQTGARWQLKKFQYLSQKFNTNEALAKLVNAYTRNADANLPVHQWRATEK